MSEGCPTFSPQIPRVLIRPEIKGDSSLSTARVLKDAITALEQGAEDDDLEVIIGNLTALLKAVN